MFGTWPTPMVLRVEKRCGPAKHAGPKTGKSENSWKVTLGSEIQRTLPLRGAPSMAASRLAAGSCVPFPFCNLLRELCIVFLSRPTWCHKNEANMTTEMVRRFFGYSRFTGLSRSLLHIESLCGLVDILHHGSAANRCSKVSVFQFRFIFSFVF